MQKIAALLAGYVICKGVIKEEEKEVYEYGFLITMETMLGLMISILITVPLHMVPEGILFFLIFIPLRSYAGGLHLKHYPACLTLSCLTYLCILLVVRLVDMPVQLSITILLVLIGTVWRLYPVEHVNRLVDEEENVYFKKKLKQYLIIYIFLAAVFFFFKYEKYLLLMTATFFLICSTMLIGKIKNKNKEQR